MLTRLRLENYKSWKDTGDIPMKPITGFFGANSSGKSSLLQALLLMKQTVDSPDRGIVLHFGDERTLVDVGDFEGVVHRNDTNQTIKFSLDWKSEIEIEVPEKYGNGSVARHVDVGFDTEIGREVTTFRGSPVLKEMSYRIPHRRRFGVRRLSNGWGYAQLLDGMELEHRLRPGQLIPAPTLQFNDFSRWIEGDFEDRGFLSSLQHGLESLLRNTHYLGPLRAEPRRFYSWSGARPSDVGQAGESVVSAIAASKQSGQAILDDTGSHYSRIDEYVAGWLKRLGLADDFRVETLDDNGRFFVAKVRKSPTSPEVLLADVGFGVSQVLPVLVLCFYVRPMSTVVLEQPDIHLHPSAQARLADVFIDAWKKYRIQILFESHGEHLLRRLQRRIAEGSIKQDDIGLFFCFMEEDGSSSLSHLELDEYGNIANWPKDFFGDQFGEIAAMSEAALKRKAESD